MNKQHKKRYDFLKKLEIAIDKDDNFVELDSILNNYYAEFQDTLEEAKQLRKKYPQFPKITNYFYDSAIEDEKYEFEDNDENEIIHKSDFELELLKIAEDGDNKFISKYLIFINEIGDISDQIYEKLNKNKANILPIVINAINDRIKICKKKKIVKSEITNLLSLIGKGANRLFPKKLLNEQRT